MIDLANKCVLVRTHEEYKNILKVAKKQGYRWYGGKEVYPYPFEEQQIPDILKFYSNKELTRNADLAPGYELVLVEASDVTEDEKELKDAIRLVRAFVKNPDRTALTESFIKSLKLLADAVENQLKEVKQMIKISKIAFEALRDTDGNASIKPVEWWRRNKLACIWCILCMLAEIPIAILRFVLMAICFIPHKIYEHLEDMSF